MTRIVLLAVPLAVLLAVSHTQPFCKPKEFDCGDNSECVPSSWVCDGEVDCDATGLDERQDCCAQGKQFECVSDGLCVDMQYRCDSFSDCDDSSDEYNCTTCSKPDLFHCGTNKCVDPVFVCDQDNDCGDFTDELGCGTERPSVYQCQNGLQSVEMHKLCDRINDCGDMSDEIGCAPCEAFHFQCHNNEKCVLVFDLCDGVAQCSDNSDEYWCQKCDKDREFKCRNGRCVQNSRVCNLINDCGDKSDEDECACDPAKEFECASGIREYFNASNVKCIPNTWLCDKVNDCNQGEDEQVAMCEARIEAMTEKPECTAEQFECMDGYCIDSAMVCDGIPHCDQGEDEFSCPVRCPRGKYQLCQTSEECLSYDQFCDEIQDCSDNSDESFTNGFCVCSGVLCGGKCVTIDKVCNSQWDCHHGEDERDCTRCRPNLHDTANLIDQTVYVINLIKSTYGEFDNFQVYFNALARQWTGLFGDISPFHIEKAPMGNEAKNVVEKTQEFLVGIISLRPSLRQFIAVMKELGFTDRNLPYYDELAMLKPNDENMKRYIIERSDTADLYADLVTRTEYLRQKSLDSTQVLMAITKTLHFDFASCQDTQFLLSPTRFKRSMREVFTALTLVQGDATHEEVMELINQLYILSDQLHQLIVSVENFDHVIASLAYIIDDANNMMSTNPLYDLILTPDMSDLPDEEKSKPTSLRKKPFDVFKRVQDFKKFRMDRLKRVRSE